MCTRTCVIRKRTDHRNLSCRAGGDVGSGRGVSGRFDVRAHPFHSAGDRSEPPPVSCGNIELEMCFVEDLIDQRTIRKNWKML